MVLAPVALPASSEVAVRPLLSLASEAADVLCPDSPCALSIILPVDVALLVFGDRIRISRLASVDQADRKP